jgi:hypothetical protein
MSYQQKKYYYLNAYKAFLSEQDFIKLNMKVTESEIIKKFIFKCRTEYNSLPTAEVIVKQICNARAFMFVFNYNKISVASLILFDWWVQEVNTSKKIASDYELENTLDNIMIYCSRLASGKTT